MELSINYFKDEERYGFYVPTAIKQAWAAELSLLQEIDRVCNKYKIAYHAEWGSMLGAVRHGGFIPWDDDLDIGMMREDYIRFKEVAAKELPAEYAIHDYATKENHWLFLTRVVSQNQICFDEEHLHKYHNFPYIACVDIFVMDYLYRDEAKERERCDEVKYILAVAEGIIEKHMVEPHLLGEIQKLEKRYHVTLTNGNSPRDVAVALYRLAETQMARVPKEESDRVVQLFPWGLKGNPGLPKKYYEERVRVPFEQTTIPVLADYRTLLERRYGDYLAIHKVWDGHNYPYFEGQRKNLLEVADMELPEFIWSKELLHRTTGEENQSLPQIGEEYLHVITQLMEHMQISAASREYDTIIALLPECQQLVVDLGSLIEQVRGERRTPVIQVVEALQGFCEAMYLVFTNLTSEEIMVSEEELLESVKQSVKQYEVAANCVRELFEHRKTSLFVCTGYKEWAGFETLYHQLVTDVKQDIYVTVVPVVCKDALGRADLQKNELSKELERFPKDVELTPWDELHVELLAPDTIYIQDPYDGENPCLTIPPQFYAKTLRQYTRQLVMVPAFDVTEFSDTDYTDVYNTKHYVAAPGVVFADTTLVQSENMRQRYIEALVTFSGPEYRAEWENRIQVRNWRRNTEVKHDNKTILYCIGINSLVELREKFCETIRERLETFKEHKEKLQVICYRYPECLEEWNRLAPEITEEFTELLSKYLKEEWCSYCSIEQTNWNELSESCSAYYGAPSPLVHYMTAKKKPVMIEQHNM